MDRISMEALAAAVLAARPEASKASSLAETAAALGAPPPSPHSMDASFGSVVRWGEVAAKLANVASAAKRQRRNRPTRECAEDEVVVLAASLLSRHPNVLPLSQVCCATSQALAVCTPWADGCLLDVLRHQANARSRALGVALPIGSESCQRWFSDIVHGVYHLVSRLGVVPVDISAENVLLFKCLASSARAPHEALIAVLADFGQVALVGGLCHPDVGKPSTRPPEAACGADSLDADATAAFQLGLLLFAMLTGVSAFSTTSPRDPAFTAFLTGRVQPRGMSRSDAAAAAPSCDAATGVAALADAYRVQQYIPFGLMPLLGGLMHPDPAQRMPLRQLVRHSWILPVRPWHSVPDALRCSSCDGPPTVPEPTSGASSSSSAAASPAAASAASSSSSAAGAVAGRLACPAPRALPVPGFPVAPDCVMTAASDLLRSASRAAQPASSPPLCTPRTKSHTRIPDSGGSAIGTPASAAAIEVRSACPAGTEHPCRRCQSRSSTASTPAAAEAAAERASCSPLSFDGSDPDDAGPCSVRRTGLARPVAVSQRAAAGQTSFSLQSPRARKRERAASK